MKKRNEHTTPCAVLAAAMITRLNPLVFVFLEVLLPRRIRKRAPSLSIWSLLACAAVPDPADLFEVAVFQRASRLGRLRDGICRLVADSRMSRRDVDLGPRAVMPLDRLMATRMMVRVAVTHCDNGSCCIKAGT
jgi:hypothetical protein